MVRGGGREGEEEGNIKKKERGREGEEEGDTRKRR